MDIKQEDMKSFKIMNRKIFNQMITSTLILPLSFIFLFEIQASNLLTKKMKHTGTQETPPSKLFDIIITPEFITLLLFKFAYYTFLHIFSLLSTSAIVFTSTTPLYTGKLDLSFKKVMSGIFKVWKRLMLRFLCEFALILYYTLSAFVSIMVYVLTAIEEKQTYMKVIHYVVGSVLVMILFFKLVFVTLIWQLAAVVTVLEDSYEFEAVDKISVDNITMVLLKEKFVLSSLIFFTVGVCIVWIRWLFEVEVVVDGSWRFGYVDRTTYGILILNHLSCIFLFGIVLQTVFYFVCKSYQHEIDKYVGEHVPCAIEIDC